MRSHCNTARVQCLLAAACIVAVESRAGTLLRRVRSPTTAIAPTDARSARNTVHQTHRGNDERDSEDACRTMATFEDKLDRLSWAAVYSFPSPFGGHVQPPAGENRSSGEVAGSAAAGLERFAAARLSEWQAAVTRMRVQEPRGESQGGVKHTPQIGREHDVAATRVLPPACPHELPVEDPYWSQTDSYTVQAEGGYDIVYNAYGNWKQFTNLERVDSLRRTLSTTKRLLQAHSAEYLLYGGSAIGAYRCEDVLPWDLDGDVAVQQAAIPGLLRLLEGAHNGTGWGGLGRGADLGWPFEGFALWEKQVGCMPLAVIDKSTGFFVDVFPIAEVEGSVLSPWSPGQSCPTDTLFPPCHAGQCWSFSAINTLPPSRCQILHEAYFSCAANTWLWLVEQYGESVSGPDTETRLR